MLSSFLCPPETSQIQGSFETLLDPLPLTPKVRGPVLVLLRERGNCEFLVMINSVLKALFSVSYLSPELNGSLFPALWMLEWCRIIWDAPPYPTGEGAFDYLFISLPLYLYLSEQKRKWDKGFFISFLAFTLFISFLFPDRELTSKQ